LQNFLIAPRTLCIDKDLSPIASVATNYRMKHI